MSEPRLTLADCHAMQPRYCNKGIRAVCERHGLDLELLRGEGIPFSDLRHVDDAMLHAVMEKAQARHDQEPSNGR